MSKRNPNLDNSIDAVRELVKWLSSIDQVEKIYLVGSRSPLRTKQPHEHSDWDLHVVSSVEKLRLPYPSSRGVHADLSISDHSLKMDEKAALVYPTDEYEVFT